MGNSKLPSPSDVFEEDKQSALPSPDAILGGGEKKKQSNGLDTSLQPLSPSPLFPGTGAQESGSESISIVPKPKYEYKWSDSQPLRTASVAPHPAKVTTKIGTVSQNTATAALVHPDLYSKKANREQYVSTLDLPEEEKKQALSQFDAHAVAAEDIQRLNEAIKKEPDNPEPQLKVIENYIALGSIEQADKLSDQIIATHPTWSPAYSYKAKIQADAGNYAFGVDILNKGIAQNPADPTLYNNRASIKSQSGDFQGAIQDIDTGLSFTKNPHLLENMWVQKAIIFKKLLDASEKPDAEKMIEQIYGKHDPHIDQTNKEFFLEKYQEAFNQANKYATQNKEITPNYKWSGMENVMGEAPKPNAGETTTDVSQPSKEGAIEQEKVRAQAELTNKIINPDKPLTNYVLEYAKEHGEQVVEGVKQAGKGLKEGGATGALDLFLGSANAAFGALSLTVPEVAGFNAVAAIAPDKLNKWAFSFASSVADALNMKPTEGSIGDKALKTADLLIPLLILHKKGAEAEEVKKIEVVEEKLKNGQELSKEDAPIIAETLREQATDANLKKAVEDSGKAEPIKSSEANGETKVEPKTADAKVSSSAVASEPKEAATTQTEVPKVEEKPVSPIENKVAPKVKYEIPEKLKIETVKPEEAILVKNIPVEDIKVDPDLRSKIEERLKSGIESTKGDAPISVKYNSDGSLEIMDGLHRLISKKPGETIDARVFNVEQSHEKFVPAPKEESILPAPSSVKRGDEIMVLQGEFKGQLKKVEGYGKLAHFETGDKTGGYTVFVENNKGEHVPVTHWEKVSKEESPQSIKTDEPVLTREESKTSEEVTDTTSEQKKAVINRVHEGKTPEEIKTAVEKHGLNYTVETHPEAERLAFGFVKEVGIDNALEAVRDNKVEGGAAPFVWATAIDAVHKEYLSEKDPELKMKLAEKEASLIDEFDKKSRSSGRFSSAQQAAYQVSDLGYKLGSILNRAKDANLGEGVSEILKGRLADLSSKLEEVNQKMADREKSINQDTDTKIAEEVDKLVKTIYEKLPTERRRKADKAIAALEGMQAKLRANAYSSVVPIPIIDAGISVIKSAIKAGVNIADAVELGINHIKERYGKNWERENDFRKDVLDEFKKQSLDFKKEPRDENELEKYKKAIRKSIERRKDKLAQKDFSKKSKPSAPDLDKEAFDLLVEKNKLKDEIDTEIEKIRLKNRPMIDKVEDNFIDILNLPKSLMASADLSAPLRQGAVLSFKHPIITSKTMVEMFRQAFSEKKAVDWLTRLRSSPEYDVMQKAGLYISEPTAKLSAKEEQFISNIAHKIPIWGKVVKGSERAYTGYLNKLRVDVFSQFHDGLIKQGIKGEELNRELESFSDFVNNASGRGNLGRFEDSAAGLNAFFFSPRYAVSRFNLINPYEYVKMAPKAREEALKTLGVYIGMGSTVLALAQAGGAKVVLDPRSSDFGKIRIGDTRFDIWSGFQQWVRLIAQVATGQKTDLRGKTKELGKGYKSDTRLDLIGHFLRFKASPALGSSMDVLSGKDAGGNDVSYKFKDLNSFLNTEEGKLITPLYLQDLSKAMESDNKAVGAAGAVGSFFGAGVSTYSDKKK